jgi:BlaI family penicillinase repressor
MPIPQISDAEWEIMKTLWDHGPLTSGQVVEKLDASSSWRPRTIKTLLARLVRKGAVTSKQHEKRTLYAPKVARDTVIRRETRSFLARVFDGAVTPALVHFIKEADLSNDQIEELKRILDQEHSNDRR